MFFPGTAYGTASTTPESVAKDLKEIQTIISSVEMTPEVLNNILNYLDDLNKKIKALADINNQKEPVTKEEIASYIKNQAVLNEIPPDPFLLTAIRESGLNVNAVGDGHLTCKRTGKRVYSVGIWQINLCSHYSVSWDVATSVIKSTEWAIEKFKENPCIWTEYKNVFPKNCKSP